MTDDHGCGADEEVKVRNRPHCLVELKLIKQIQIGARLGHIPLDHSLHALLL